MGEIAAQSWQNFNKFTKESLEVLLQLLKSIADVIEDTTAYAPYRRMASYIRDEGQVHFYQIQGNCTDQLIQALDANKIPYLRLMDERTILIQENMVSEIQDINRQILVNRGNYFQEVPIEEMMATPKAVKQNTICFYGLDKYEAEVFKNKCNNITSGFMVGAEPMSDGTFNLAVYRENMFTYGLQPETNDTCKAYLHTMFSLHGDNAEQKKKEIDYDEKVDTKVWESIKNKKNCFIASSANRFLEITENGFEVYATGLVNGKREEKQIKKVDLRDINFSSELERWLDRLSDKIYCENIDELNKVLAIKPAQRPYSKELGDMRPVRQKNQIAMAKAGAQMANAIDVIVKEKMQESSFFNEMDEVHKFAIYMDESKKVLEAYRDGLIPEGYSNEQMEHLKSVATAEYRGNHETVAPDKIQGIITSLSRSSCKSRQAHSLTEQEKRKVKEDRQNGFFNVNR